MSPTPLHQRFARTRRALPAAVAIALAAGHAPPADAQGSPATPPAAAIAIDIPAQPLSQALNALARRANLQMSFPAALVEGRRAPAVSGPLTVQQALARLLAGSGLEATVQDGSVVVRRVVAPADEGLVLPTVTVRASRLRPESSRYAADSAAITRGAASLKEVPQSVTVLTSKAIEDQGLTLMSDAMVKMTGIVATTDGLGNPEFRSRGFIIDTYQVDGLGTSYSSTFRPDFDLAIYDRVELLRGADGLFSAAGEPGGTVNLVRKRPTDRWRSAVTLSYGSWNNRRVEADLGGPLGLDGQLRGRLVAVRQDRDFFYKPADEAKRVLYGMLEFDLTQSTVLSAGISHQRAQGASWMYGLPTYTDGSQLNLPRDVALTADWARRNTTIRETFLAVEHKFNKDWSVKLGAARQHYDFDYLQLNVGGPVDTATGSFGNPSAFAEADGNHSDSADLSVNGSFHAWGHKHRLTAGVDWRRSDGKQLRTRFDAQFPDGALNVGDFPGLNLPAPTVYQRDYGWPAFGAEQNGVYARVDLQASEQVHVILGGRHGNYKHRDIYEDYDDAGQLIERDASFKWHQNGIFTPYAAVTYALNPQWTAYASVTEVYKPQGNMFTGPPESPNKLDPITGRNHELGIKGSVMDRALNVSAALYRIERNGEAVQDTRYGEGSSFYLPLGRIVSQGLDVEVSGELAPGWEVFAGYTYNQNKNRQTEAVYSALTPKHMLKLWSDLTLPGTRAKWALGGGVTVKSRHGNTGTYWAWTDAGWTQPRFDIAQGGYAVWDARVKYQIDARWALALNVNNVFDRIYYATLGVPNGNSWYGAPRSATLTLRGQF